MPAKSPIKAKDPTQRWPSLYIITSLFALSLPFLDGLQGRFLVGAPDPIVPVRDANGAYRPMPVGPSIRSTIIWTPSSSGGGFHGGK